MLPRPSQLGASASPGAFGPPQHALQPGSPVLGSAAAPDLLAGWDAAPQRGGKAHLSGECCRVRTRKLGGISFRRFKCCSVTLRFCQACGQRQQSLTAPRRPQRLCAGGGALRPGAPRPGWGATPAGLAAATRGQRAREESRGIPQGVPHKAYPRHRRAQNPSEEQRGARPGQLAASPRPPLCPERHRRHAPVPLPSAPLPAALPEQPPRPKHSSPLADETSFAFASALRPHWCPRPKPSAGGARQRQ